MSVKKTNHRISLTLPKKDFEQFQKVNPNCLSRFLRNCVIYGATDKDFFQSVFFMELDDTLNNVVQSMYNKLDGVI